MALWRADRARIYAQEEATAGTDPQGARTYVGALIKNVDVTPPTVARLTYPAVGTDRHYAVTAAGQISMAEIRLPLQIQIPKLFRYLFEGRKTNLSTPNVHIYAPIGNEPTKGDLGISGQTVSGQAAADNYSLPLLTFTTEISYEDPTGSTNHFVRQYTGCKVNGVELTIDSSGELVGTLDVTAMGQYVNSTRTTAALTSFTGGSTRPYMFYDAKVNLFSSAAATQNSDGTMAMGAAKTYARVSGFTVNVQNQLTQRYYLTAAQNPTTGPTGGQYVYDLVPGLRQITGTMDLLLDTEAALALSGGTPGVQNIWSVLLSMSGTTVPFDMEIIFDRAGSTSDELKLQLFDCWLTKAPHTVPEEKADISVTMEFGARKMRAQIANALTSGDAGESAGNTSMMKF